MKWEVFYTEQAETDLRNVFEYIAFTLLVPETAKKQVQRIMKEIAALDNMPFRYKLYHKEPWKSRGLRTFSIDNYLVFYMPDEEKNTVSIIRIMYGGRDIEKHL